MGADEATAVFFSWRRGMWPQTQQQAHSTLLLSYKQVLEIDLPWLENLVRPKKPVRLPTVLNPSEIQNNGVESGDCIKGSTASRLA
jgi:hypothetical protein